MQKSVDCFFKVRKRPATDDLDGYKSKSRMTARKLFENEPEKERKFFPKSVTEQIITKPVSPITESLEQTPTDSSSVREDEKEQNKEEKSDEIIHTPPQSPKTKESLKKIHGLGEFKQKIACSRKYSLLKKGVQKFNKTVAALNKYDDIEIELSSPRAGKFSPRRLQFENLQRTPTKQSMLMSPVKSPATRRELMLGGGSPTLTTYVSPSKLLAQGPHGTLSSVRASTVERYHHLLAADKEPLVLPHRYAILREIFRAVDTIARIMSDRGELVTYRKIRLDVQKLIGRNFTEEHLAKIKTVFPEAYILTRERIKSPLSREEKYELVIKFKEDEEKSGSSSMVERQKHFHNVLLEITKKHHENFLSTLDPPIVVKNDLVKRWHPEFDLNDVPDIEAAPLPQPPSTDNSLTTAKNVLEKTHDIISMNNRMAKAITTIDNSVEKNKTDEEQCAVNNDPIPAFHKALQGIPKALLEKIRAKQAEKLKKSMMQTPAEEKEAIMYSRLSELAKILRNVFVSERKGVLPEKLVLLKIGHSYREKLATNELLEHLRLISKQVPGWMNFCVVRNESYIRLSKESDMSRILGKLDKLAEQRRV